MENYDDSRDKPRKALRLRAEVQVADQKWLKGFVRDLSGSGATLSSDFNLLVDQNIKLHISFYPLVVTDKTRVIEVNGKIVYTIYSSATSDFRSGIQFIKFASKTDQEYLELRLSAS